MPVEQVFELNQEGALNASSAQEQQKKDALEELQYIIGRCNEGINLINNF